MDSCEKRPFSDADDHSSSNLKNYRNINDGIFSNIISGLSNKATTKMGIKCNVDRK